jgi:predicted ArsR family transcriptional regulator
MIIESIALQIDITDGCTDLNHFIETRLQQWGEPLRWAITTVDLQTNIANVEAIVIRDRGRLNDV